MDQLILANIKMVKSVVMAHIIGAMVENMSVLGQTEFKTELVFIQTT